MDAQTIIDMISTIGFPVVCCIAMFWYINVRDKRQEEKNASYQQQINELMTAHASESLKYTEVIEKNTAAISQMESTLKDLKELIAYGKSI